MRFYPLTGLFIGLMVAGGCASSQKMIVTEPPGATVVVNGQPAGVTPTRFEFDFGKRTKYEISVKKEGFVGVSQDLYSETPMSREDTLRFTLPKDLSWDQTVDSEAANKWVKIQILPQFTQQSMWQRVVDSVTTRYSNLEQMDQASGYIRSIPTVKTYKDPTGGEYSIRTYFLGSTASTDPLVFKVKIASEHSEGADKWTPNPRVFREDQQLIEELQTRLGIK